MEFQCRVIVQRRCAPSCGFALWKTFRSKANAIPVYDKTVRLPTGIGVRLQTGMLFGITTAWCSLSDRNRVRLRPDFPNSARSGYVSSRLSFEYGDILAIPVTDSQRRSTPRGVSLGWAA